LRAVWFGRRFPYFPSSAPNRPAAPPTEETAMNTLVLHLHRRSARNTVTGWLVLLWAALALVAVAAFAGRYAADAHARPTAAAPLPASHAATPLPPADPSVVFTGTAPAAPELPEPLAPTF
jgi:hypothetical protein